MVIFKYTQSEFFFTIVFLFVICDSFLVPDGLQSVQTKLGEIHGHLATVQFDGEVYQVQQFLGIPYANAPVGDRRFRKPERLAALPHLPFQAVKAGSVCPQVYAAMFNLSSSEDCLFLNIYSPMGTTDTVAMTAKQVMVYIHGGGFVTGWSQVFDASVLSAYGDVIVVTINYRIGPLGFFSTHSPDAPGNFGLWDQQMAVQWIKDNIAAFGGNPNSITIFGESAGGSSVIYQMLYPENKGLIKRAISQSGTTEAWGRDHKGLNMRESLNFAELVGCGNTTNSEMMKCLRSKSSDEMIIKTNQYGSSYSPVVIKFPWVPVYDEDFVTDETTQILTDLSDTCIPEPLVETFRDIDLMIGDTSMDGTVLLPRWIDAMNKSSTLNSQYEFTRKQMVNVALPKIGDLALGETPTGVALHAMEYEYIDWGNPDNVTRLLKSLVDMTTDYAVNVPVVLTANGHQYGPRATYLYQFSLSPPRPNAELPPALQSSTAASHGDELSYVFGFPTSLLPFVGFTQADVTREDYAVSKLMITMWTNFAKTGDPNSPKDLTQFYDGLYWPRYDLNNEQYLEVTSAMSGDSVKRKLRARAVQFWSELLPELQRLSSNKFN